MCSRYLLALACATFSAKSARSIHISKRVDFRGWGEDDGRLDAFMPLQAAVRRGR